MRTIDAYVNTLDLQALDFTNSHPVKGAGQPAYDPAALLKLYLYGYLQGIRSSRKLEREANRNMEVMWLAEGSRPTYKTIADFRKANGVAVDGSFFKADASKTGIYTEDKLNKQLEELDKKIADYQQALAEQDAADDRAGGPRQPG